MGQSTDAYLYYGMDVYDAEEGVMPPKMEEVDPEADVDEWLSEQLKGTDIEYSTHCSSSYPVYFISVYCLRAWRGYPKAITEQLTVPDGAREKLIEVAKKLGFENPEPKIGWWLASYAEM